MPFLKNIFSIKDSDDRIRKIITFLGIKIKIKAKTKRKKKPDKNAKTNNFGIKINNEEVVILANGPSLNDSLSDKDTQFFIKSKNKMCLNFFPQTEQFFDLKPNFLLCMDPVYWSHEIVERLKEPVLKTISKIEEVNWDIYIILPQYAQEWNWFMQIAQKNEHIKIIYVNTQESYCKKEIERFLEYKTNISMPGPQNVLIACIYCAINLGYKKIYIFGADHSWHTQLVVNEDNVVCTEVSHFYNKKNETEIRPCYKDPEGKCTFTMRELMSVFAITYEKYEILERYSKFMGSKIYNMSKVSYIDAFERKKLGEKEYVEQ